MSQSATSHMAVTNPHAWAQIAHEIETHTGVPLTATVAEVANLVSSAVALLYAADASGDMEVLRGVFCDAVVGQCELNRGCLEGTVPAPGGQLTLIGVPFRPNGDPIRGVRVRAEFPVTTLAGTTRPSELFMDVEFGSQVTVSAARNCVN
ncbi:MAG: hypothetical protein ABSH51_01255, partial [Solirubrobacteraceae bacterium]